MFFNLVILSLLLRGQRRLEGIQDLVQPLLRDPKLPRLSQVGRRTDVLLRQVLDSAVVVDSHDVEDRLLAKAFHFADAVDPAVDEVDGDPAVSGCQHFRPVQDCFA